MLRLALPSDRVMEEPTLEFMRYCGLAVKRSSVRSYAASIAGLDQVSVLFQRSVDIPQKLEDGSVDLSIVGLDRWKESGTEDGPGLVVMEDLGFGVCDLVVGVPDAWIDVTSIADLAELALEFRQQGKELRIVTKYPRLAQRFFQDQGINYFEIVSSAGAMEIAPALGYADVVVDVMTTGATFRENRLKVVEGGRILHSEACVVANRATLREDTQRVQLAKAVLEAIEARLGAGGYVSVTANIRGASEERIARQVVKEPALAGMQGPTVAKVFSKGGQGSWFAVTVVVPQAKLLAVVEHLRSLGASGMSVVPVQYVFSARSESFAYLTKELRLRSTPKRRGG
ncbi:MAG: ATP phosphoribosyltransferase [Chloroflexi bacterium]|nr:ATP phosphoribosyltransferase [Chloroflexota bacterium]